MDELLNALADVAKYLRQVETEREALLKERHVLIGDARAEGATWTQVNAAIGVSNAQMVWDRRERRQTGT